MNESIEMAGELSPGISPRDSTASAAATSSGSRGWKSKTSACARTAGSGRRTTMKCCRSHRPSEKPADISSWPGPLGARSGTAATYTAVAGAGVEAAGGMGYGRTGTAAGCGNRGHTRNPRFVVSAAAPRPDGGWTVMSSSTAPAILDAD